MEGLRPLNKSQGIGILMDVGMVEPSGRGPSCGPLGVAGERSIRVKPVGAT